MSVRSAITTTLRAVPTRWGLALPAAVVAVDQLTKWAATRAFGEPMSICASNPDVAQVGHHIEVSPIADLSLLCNPGVSWGLLQGDSPLKRWALLLFALGMIAVLYNILATARDTLTRLCVSMLIGGAIGNAIDRALFGAVTDFVDASDIGFNYVFNVADSAITIGIVGLIFTFIRDALTERREAKAGAAK